MPRPVARIAVAAVPWVSPWGRASIVAAVAGAFAVLFIAARSFGGDAGILGLSDDAVRTIAHFTVYGSLALALAKALGDWRLLAWTITLAFATAEELHQLLVPWRFGCVSDWLLNVAGITVFLLAYPTVTAAVRRCLAAYSGNQATARSATR